MRRGAATIQSECLKGIPAMTTVERSEMSTRLAPLLIATLALASLAAADVPEAPTADPCAVSQFVCDEGSAAYHAVQDALEADPGDGMAGILAGALQATPDASAVWTFVAATDANIAAAQASGYGSVHVAPPSVPSRPSLDASSAQLQALADALPQEDAEATLAHAQASLPVDPRIAVADLVYTLGTLSVEGLLPHTTPVAVKDAQATPMAPVSDGAAGVAAPAQAAAGPMRDAAFGAADEVLASGSAVAEPRAAVGAGPLLSLPLPGWLLDLQAPPLAVLLILLLLIPPLYSRIQRERLLEHPIRERLYAAVAAHPGVHIEELARLANTSRSTAVYHLHLMARHGHVTALGRGKTTHYYANNGRSDPDDRERRALLASPRVRDLAVCIAENPGITRQALAAQVGIGASTVSWHLGRLMAQRLVEDRFAGDARVLYPGPTLRELLRPWRESAAAMPATALPEPEPAVPQALAPIAA